MVRRGAQNVIYFSTEYIIMCQAKLNKIQRDEIREIRQQTRPFLERNLRNSVISLLNVYTIYTIGMEEKSMNIFVSPTITI